MVVPGSTRRFGRSRVLSNPDSFRATGMITRLWAAWAMAYIAGGSLEQCEFACALDRGVAGCHVEFAVDRHGVGLDGVAGEV